MSFTKLVKEMLLQAATLDHYFLSSDLPEPSFDEDTLEALPPQMEEARLSLIDTAQTLKQLALGSRGIYGEVLFAFADEVALRAVYKYKLAQAVPLTGSATFAEISLTSGLNENLVERFLRQAMSNHIFTESPPGHVSHTAASRLLVTNSDTYDAVGLVAFEFSPVGMKTLYSLSQFPNSEEPTEAAWTLQNEPGVSTYQFLAKHPERARRFGAGMRYFGRGQGWDLEYLVKAYEWAELDRPETVFIDVGGGQGTVARVLAKTTKNMRFKVQDLPGTIADGEQALPAELHGRIEFMAHDFFTEQPFRGADVYFFRWIFHNWSDKYCRRILRELIPALRNGAMVLIYEFVLRDGPETRLSQKQARNLDMLMLAQFNALERTAKQWKSLIESVDPRFKLARVVDPPKGSLMSIIEAVWTEETDGDGDVGVGGVDGVNVIVGVNGDLSAVVA